MEQEIKDCWRSARFSNTTDNYSPHQRTTLQRLIRRYKRFSRIALSMAGCVPLYFFTVLRDNTTASMWQITYVTVFMMIYFITVSIMDCWIARGLSSINITEGTVSEVCHRAFFYRKRHFQFIAVLIPMGLMILSSLAWLFSDNRYILNGMVSGAIIGGIVAITALRRFMKEYKDLTHDEM